MFFLLWANQGVFLGFLRISEISFAISWWVADRSWSQKRVISSSSDNFYLCTFKCIYNFLYCNISYICSLFLYVSLTFSINLAFLLHSFLWLHKLLQNVLNYSILGWGFFPFLISFSRIFDSFLEYFVLKYFKIVCLKNFVRFFFLIFRHIGILVWHFRFIIKILSIDVISYFLLIFLVSLLTLLLISFFCDILHFFMYA